MVTISSHNPFRAQPLSPAATGNSINPPPSFHTVAGDDETTLNPLTDIVPNLSSIPEAADQERDLPPIPMEGQERNRARQHSPSPVITLEPPPPPIQEEEPPAYTATPDLRRGESTLDVGPRRAFQQPRSTRATASNPGSAQGPGLTPSYTGSTTTSSSPNFLTPSLTGFPFAQRRRDGHRPGFIQQIAGSLVDQLQNVAFGPSAGDSSAAQSSQGARSAPRHARSFSSFTSSPGPSTSPPPLPLRQTPSAPRLSPDPSRSRDRSPSTISNSTTTTRTSTISTTSTTPGSTTSAAVSDFARDFYAAGTADGLLRLDLESSSHHHHSRNRSHDVDDDIPLELRMPSPPPNSRRRNSFDASQIATSSLAPQLQSQLSTSSPSSPTLATVDDCKPTSKPVPGHPLLRGGKLLVYPKGHTCSKCFNIGYKRADPGKPCKKCWAKFGKPYVPLLYAPSANATTTLQRPLPVFAQPPPQGPPNLPPMTRVPSAPGAGEMGQQGLARPSGSCGTYQSNSVRSHRYSPSEPPYMPSYHPIGVIAGGVGSPPPAGAPVYPAGDRRLGGVRCWMCGGTGTVSHFIFDQSQCDTCKGVGRWYM